jgi:hypothetical protein
VNVDGDAGKPVEAALGSGGGLELTGVAVGVDCCEETDVLIVDVWGCFCVGTTP